MDLSITVQYVDRKENLRALGLGEDFGSCLCCSGSSGLTAPLCLPPFSKPQGWVEIGVRVSATEFSSLPSVPRACQEAAWVFPWCWHIRCLQGDRVGDIMLGLVRTKRLFKKKNNSRYCHFLLKSQLYFTSIESGHKLSGTYSIELRTVFQKCFPHLQNEKDNLEYSFAKCVPKNLEICWEEEKDSAVN